MDINTLISYINSIDSLEFQNSLIFFKIIFLLISLFFLIVIFFFLSKTQYLKLMYFQNWKEFLTYRAYGARRMIKVWEKIIKRLEGAQESEYKLAVIEADETLNDVLEKIGFTGQTIEERLGKLTPEVLPNIDQLKEAHQVRDNILHDPDFRLGLEKAKKTLDVYEKSLRDLEVI